MEAKEIMSKFDELYGMMASSANVKYMHVFGNTMRCMMKDMASSTQSWHKSILISFALSGGRTILPRRRLLRL